MPVVEARVVISSSSLQGSRETITDARGRFLFIGLPVGTYGVRILHPVYQDASIQNIAVRLGRTTSLGEIRLTLRVQDAREITVSAERPTIDMASTSGSSNLEISIVETLPVQRNYRNLMLLLPGTTVTWAGEEANIAGATEIENRYFIDGIETTDPFRGVSGTRLPYNFIKELEVKVGGYEAEYRSSLGGVVNVITSSGGNEFSGQVFGFFANSRFAGEPRASSFQLPKGAFSQYDFGLSLGGPIIRDKLWFFAAYNPTFEREEVELPGSGTQLDSNTTHIFAGKLTWQASPMTSLVLTVNGDPSVRNAVGDTWGAMGPFQNFENPDPFLERIERGGVNFSLKGTQIVSNRFFLEADISRINRLERNLPSTERGRELCYIDYTTSSISGGLAGRMDNASFQTTFSVKGTWLLDRHLIKAGLDYRETRLDNDWTYWQLGRLGEDTYQVLDVYSGGTFRSRAPSVFVQDSWEASRRLRVNFGLRWEGQTLIASDGRASQRILDQFQPRVGIVYQLGELGTQKVYASFGRFYEELMLYVMSFHGTDKGQWGMINYDHDPRVDPTGGAAYILPSQIQPEVPGLKGQHYDEFSLGYERTFGKSFKVGVRGIFRTLREAIDNGTDPVSGVQFMGNPGSGPLSAFPKARREYSGLEFTIERIMGKRFTFFASYVLSRNYGNYAGLSDYGFAGPNCGSQFDQVEMYQQYFVGWLPNDRTHVFKFNGAYRWDFGLTIGTSVVWQSGTPLDEWGASRLGSPYWKLIRQRGTAGRIPSIFDLNIRVVYDITKSAGARTGLRAFLDIFHIGSRRSPVEFDTVHYFNQDANGNQIDPNPTYGWATRYFPPMSARLGLELGF
ncbi:MAG: TonB-dependent receptor [Candidatus Aminicenantes bacterium]|nr:TonB-dependent receptor [Candidatus Aminicenantes bacterium]